MKIVYHFLVKVVLLIVAETGSTRITCELKHLQNWPTNKHNYWIECLLMWITCTVIPFF